MAVLDKKQVNYIHDILIDHGVTYEALQIDILDHICCMVEEKMDNDLNFDESLSLSIKKFGLRNLAEIQETTIYLLTLKIQKMKKLTGIFGIISSLLVITGVLFKINHWPGASIALFAGLTFISLIVFPFMAYLDLKSNTGKNKLTTLSIYISGIIFVLSSLFKINHWPGAIIMFDIATIILVFIYIPSFTIKNYKTSENKIFAIAKSSLIIAGIFIFWVLLF